MRALNVSLVSRRRRRRRKPLRRGRPFLDTFSPVQPSRRSHRRPAGPAAAGLRDQSLGGRRAADGRSQPPGEPPLHLRGLLEQAVEGRGGRRPRSDLRREHHGDDQQGRPADGRAEGGARLPQPFRQHHERLPLPLRESPRRTLAHQAVVAVGVRACTTFLYHFDHVPPSAQSPSTPRMRRRRLPRHVRPSAGPNTSSVNGGASRRRRARRARQRDWS